MRLRHSLDPTTSVNADDPDIRFYSEAQDAQGNRLENVYAVDLVTGEWLDLQGQRHQGPVRVIDTRTGQPWPLDYPERKLRELDERNAKAEARERILGGFSVHCGECESCRVDIVTDDYSSYELGGMAFVCRDCGHTHCFYGTMD